MEIFFSAYRLQPRHALNSKHSSTLRPGFLMKVISQDGIGYADLCPWPELGDEAVEVQLKSLTEGHPTFLVSIALFQATRDAKARAGKKSLVDAENLLKNNFLVSAIDDLNGDRLESLKKLGFEMIKLKAGRDLDRELFYAKKVLETGNFRLRLDFNGSLEWASFQKFFETVKTKYIEYVEDPMSYSDEIWTEGRRFVPLALDFEGRKILWEGDRAPAADVIIVKPARVNLAAVMACVKNWKMSFAVTSSMDHPVGVINAYSWAQELDRYLPEQSLEPGCMTFESYEKSAYNDMVTIHGPWLQEVEGYGVGFDDLLEKEPWIQIS
jgi:O-succinylbenzoate synthase